MRKFPRFLKLLPILVLAVILLTTAAMAADETFDTENFVGLVLQNTEPETVSVKLYSGFSATTENLQTPVHTETDANGDETYYYAVTAKSRYYCVAKPISGYARYNEQRCIYITEEEATQKTVMDVTPPKRSTSGWDPSGAVLFYTDETMTNIYKSDASLWPQYAQMFTTPAFQSGRNVHRQTTQTEMMNFLKDLDGDDDKMHMYILGQSDGATDYEKSFDIPLVLFTTTELDGTETLEEAAAKVKANGKLTVHYQAQIHGDEQGAGEAALGMIKRLNGAYGDGLLDTMNIYVIPRLNPRGAYKSQRVSYLNGSTTDPNRDFLHLYTKEVQARMRAYNLFDPEVVFDNHEYQVTTQYNRIKWKDMSLCCTPVFYFTQDFQDTALEIADAAFTQLKADGLTYRWYDDSVGGIGGHTGSSNTAIRSSIHILMETDGCDRGIQFYERRVAAHASAVGGILAYLDENAEQVQAVVQEQRDLLVEKGKTYEEDDLLVFDYSTTDREDLNLDGKYILLDSGTIESTTVKFPASYPTTITRSRVAPTAYVIPAGESYTETVLALMDKQGISYYQIPAGSTVNLQQYSLAAVSDTDGLITEAALSAEQAVTFANGAYVFTMAQVDREILAMLMEPDFNLVRSMKGTLVQLDIITADADGNYPIYRYIHDLNAKGEIDLVEQDPDAPQTPAAPEGLIAVGAAKLGGTGKIAGLDATKAYEYRAEGATEYTAVAVGTTEIADLPLGNYYVRFAETADAEASAAAQVTVAYEKLTECVIYVDGVNGDNTNTGFTEEDPVKYLTKADEILDELMQYADEGMVPEIVLTGNVTITTMAYTMPAHDYPVIISGKTGSEGFIYNASTSSKRYFIMGGDTTFRNLTLTLKTSGTDNYLGAGGHKLVIEDTVKTVANSAGNYFNLMVGRNSTGATGGELIVKGGTWRYVYAGAYQTAHHDSSRMVLSNCTISLLSNSYNYTTDGDIYMELRNVTVKEAIYCGNRYSNHVDGDVTLVLGEGTTSPKIYAGSKAGNITGKVTVIADGIDLASNTIYGKSESTSGTIGGLKLVVNKGELADVADTFVTRDGVDIVLGCDQTEAATLNYSCNLDLNGCDATITVADGKTLTVCDTATDDFTVNDAEGYGILSVTGTAAAKEGYIVLEETNGYSYHRKELKLDNVVLRPSATGIYYTGQFGLNERCRTDVDCYGVVLSLDPDPDLDKDGCKYTELTEWPDTGAGYGTVLQGIMTQNGGYSSNKANAERVVYGVAYIKYTDGTVEYSNPAQCTLRDVVEASDTIWDTLTDAQKQGLLDMYSDFSNVMKSWNIPNIKAA